MLASVALFVIVTPSGGNKQSQMVLDAQKILRLLEDMLICQEMNLPLDKMITCFSKVHVKQAQSPVDDSINKADESQTIRQQSTLVYSNYKPNLGLHRPPCRAFRRWSC